MPDSAKKPNECPICGEWLNKEEFKTCRVMVEGEFDQQVNFVLRVKDHQSMYHPQTLQEDFNFSRCVRAEKDYLLEVVRDEGSQLRQYLQEYQSEGTTEQIPFIVDAIDQNLKRQKALEAGIEGLSPTRKKTPYIRNGLHYSMLAADIKECLFVYQEEFGRLVFLHPICNKYLHEEHQSNQDLPLSISSKVIYR